MKTMTGATIAALAFGLGLASTPVFAADYAQYSPDRDRGQDAKQQQDDKKGDDKGERRRDRNNNNNNANQPPAPTPTPGATDNDRRSNRQDMDFKPGRDNDNDRARDRNNNNNDNDRWRNNNDNDRFRNNNNRNDRDWNRNHRNPSININIYRRNVTSPRRYRHGRYQAPRGFHYRRWHYGERLPIAYYGRDYWLLDFIAFGLFAPPPGYVWVRYGDDALLIDTYTGEIVQVRYDVFYS